MNIDTNTIVTIASNLIAWGSAIGYLKARIDSLTEQVKRQNGSVSKIQDWELTHMTDCHSNK